jgi:hypothetical protein
MCIILNESIWKIISLLKIKEKDGFNKWRKGVTFEIYILLIFDKYKNNANKVTIKVIFYHWLGRIAAVYSAVSIFYVSWKSSYEFYYSIYFVSISSNCLDL